MNSVTELRLCDIATFDVLTVTAETPLQRVVATFVEHLVSSIIVVDGEWPVGIVTERDLLRLSCVGYDERKPVRSVMSAPLLTAQHDMDFSTAQTMLSNRAIRHLVLVDADGRLSGVASETDFRRHIGHDLFEAIQSLGAVMEPSAELIDPESSLAYALETMASRRFDHVLIGSKGVPQGIITERDVARLMLAHRDTSTVTVGAVMSSPLRSVGTEVSVAEAARELEQNALRHLVVLDRDGRLAGVISQHRMLERLSVVLLEQGRNWLAGQLDVVLEATGVGTWEFDHLRQVMVRSISLNKVLNFGSKPSEEALAGILERIEVEDRLKIKAAFDRLRSAQTQLFSADYRVRDGEGRVRWFSSRGRVVEWDAQGRALRSVGVAIDIDAQKQAEAEVKANEARLRALMENMPIPLCLLNDQHHFVYANRRFVEMFGYRLEDIPAAATWFAKAYPDPDYREWVLAHWQGLVEAAVQRDQIVEAHDYRVRCADGEEKTVAFSALVFGQELLVSIVDLTQQKRQQALLELSNAILRRISGAVPLKEVLAFICCEIESQVAGVMCAVMLVDEQGRLRTGAAPHLPSEYTRLVDGVQIGPAVGSCGTAVYRGEAIFAGDLASDPLWAEFAGLAATYGLGACWSSPIMAPDGKVLGTFALYWPQALAEVSEVAQAYVEAATAMTAIAIESERRDARIHQQLDELRRWQRVMLGRESRVLELKQEVNSLSARLGEAPRYASTEGGS